MPLKKNFLVLGILFAIALASGWGLREMRKDAAPSNAPAGAEVDLATFRRVVEEKSAVILDARAEKFYAMAHVPGARNLPKSDFLGGTWNRAVLADVPRDRRVIVYCSSVHCLDSSFVAEGLAQLGYRNVAVFKGGMKGWADAGLAPEVSP